MPLQAMTGLSGWSDLRQSSCSAVGVVASILTIVVMAVISGCGSDQSISAQPEPKSAIDAGISQPVSHSHFVHHDERYEGRENEMVAHDHLHPSFDPQAPCTCSEATLANGWCRHCNIGYVAGLRVESARLFETMDPHGHDLDLDSITCETCRLAIADGGFCKRCGMGYIGRKTYFTQLTYSLATGQSLRPEGCSCQVCLGNIGDSGWCDACQRGIVGNVAIRDRDTFDMAAGEFELLHRAIARVPACELCGCAMMVHRTCPNCLISYESRNESPPAVPAEARR